MIKRLNCINVSSKNPQKLAEFYAANNRLGWKEIVTERP